MKKRLIWLIGGCSLIIIGLVLSLPTIMQWRQSESVPKISASAFRAAAQTPASITPVVSPDQGDVEGHPVRIQIPSLHIDLAVINGYYNKQANTWTLTKDKVQYAASTPLPNNTHGNTFLYGHNRREVFRSLAKIKLGAEVILYTDNNHRFTYTFRGALETTPDDGSLFHYQGKPILTIQTCSGVWYQNRQLFTFDLKEVQ